MRKQYSLTGEQLLGKLLSGVKDWEYKVYDKTIAKNSDYTDSNNVLDIGADLQALFGSDYRIPGNSGYIAVSADICMKFNDTDHDEISWDVSLLGKVWTINRGDLLVDKLFFKNASYTEAVTVQVFISGDEFTRIDRAP